jgi:Leucine-rich repeat (LRR) protein
MNDCGLTSIPPDIAKLVNLQTLLVRKNERTKERKNERMKE